MFQRVTLIGHVGQEPQMRFTSDGTPVTNISVATKETASKKTFGGGERPCPQGWKESYNGRNWELTTWWRVTCWRGLAETVNAYLSKGRQVFVEGEIGGDAEERAAAYIAEHVTKPVIGYVAGFTAPEGKTMGHAGAIVSGSSGTALAKQEALEAVGVRVGRTPSETARLMREVLGR